MDGIAWAASAMAAAQTRLEIAAQNLANASSDGFRKRIARGRIGARGVVISAGQSRMQGSFRATGRPFDLAISGPGTFRIRTASGRIVQTRDGAFLRDRYGRLRTAQGGVVLGPRGAAVVAATGVIPDLGLPAGSSV